MVSIFRCPICGGDEQKTDGQCVRGCPPVTYSMRVTAIVDGQERCAECERLTRERDEARAEVERWKDAADELAGPIERLWELRVEVARLATLLREVEWVWPYDGQDPSVMTCYVCEHQKRNGHAPDCRLAAALK